MILLSALVAGLVTGLGWARWRGQAYHPPGLRHLWLIVIAFLPQFVTIFFPLTRERTSDPIAAAGLLLSQTLLLGFALLNWRIPGMSLMTIGIILNLGVIAANGGFMPISPQTAGHLVSEETLQHIPVGSRFGTKDILLSPGETRFEWLADRFLTPDWFRYQAAFSLGDVFIAIGIWWLLAYQAPTLKHAE
jgi:hypothetical protein